MLVVVLAFQWVESEVCRGGMGARYGCEKESSAADYTYFFF